MLPKTRSCLRTGSKMEYRVFDLRHEIVDPDPRVVSGVRSPEEAARQALGLELTRSGLKRDLAARVYFQMPDQPLTMVRLYSRSVHAA
jgi:hypothetical protein